MHPDIGPVLLVLAVLFAGLAYSAYLRVRAALLDRWEPIGRHEAPAGRATVRRVRGRFVWDMSVTPRGAR